MSDNQLEKKQGDGLTSEQLIKSGLADQVNAITEYEGVIWKIRSGYVVVLYGTLTLVLGKDGVPNICDMAHNFGHSLALISLIVSLSLSVFLIDFGYVRKKIKIVVAREELIKLACRLNFDIRNEEDRKTLKELLHIAGETRPSRLPDDVKSEYKEKRNWNLHWILLPVYLTTPLIAIFMSILCLLVSGVRCRC
jgi:hypothetical protein